jgi:hypothetical protein
MKPQGATRLSLEPLSENHGHGSAEEEVDEDE